MSYEFKEEWSKILSTTPKNISLEVREAIDNYHFHGKVGRLSPESREIFGRIINGTNGTYHNATRDAQQLGRDLAAKYASEYAKETEPRH